MNNDLEDLQADLARFLALIRPRWPHPAIAWQPLVDDEKPTRESGLRLVPGRRDSGKDPS